MIVKNPKFMLSAVSATQYPDTGLLEIAFAGRSNVGKSSLINALINRKRLARHGATPGMTRQINFYNIDDEIHFVDLPGYGYSNVSKSEKDLWADVIEKYLNVREQLYLVIFLLDIRHVPSKDDLQMYDWLRKSEINHIVVTNKLDKITKAQTKIQLELIRNNLSIPPEVKVMPVSSENKQGIKELWEVIDSFIVE